MKRLGVQIAAGAVTILLGVLAAAHAQKDRDDAPETEWKSGDVAELRQAPKPIEQIGDSRADAPDPSGRSTAAEPGSDRLAGGDSPIEPESPPIRLVQHTESLDSQAAFESPDPLGPPRGEQGENADAGANADSGDAGSIGDAPSFGMPSSLGFDAPPSDPPPNDPPQTAASQLGTHQSQGADPEAYPAELSEAMSSTESTRVSGAEDTTGDETSMPELAFGEPPAMSLPGFDGESDPPSQPRQAFDPPRRAFDPPRQAFDQGETSPPREASGASDNGFGTPPINALREPGGLDEEAIAQGGARRETRNEPEPNEPEPNEPEPNEPEPNEPEPNEPEPNEPASNVASGGGFGSWGGQPPSAPPTADHVQSESSVGMSETESPRLASLSRGMPQTSRESAASESVAGSPGLKPNGGPRTLDSPGDRRLEGAQTPSLVIQKRAPSEVKVGKPASFVISIRNVGSAEAIDVRLHDRVPVGMRLADASPSPVHQGEELVWHLGALPAGDERTVTMQLVPEQEGELGSVARVSFEAAASVRTVSTRPELKIVQRAPEAVLIGQQLEIELEVSNPGTGEAVGVVLQEDVPQGLEHPKGSQLDNLLGNLQPGEVRREVLRLRAVAPGQIRNTVRLVSEDGLTAEHTVDVEIISPQLQVGLSGPTRRYVERQATYDVRITNAGTAEASNVEIAAYLDRGFTFVSTENQGQYDPNRHAVFWSLARLPEGADATVPLTLLPVNVGEQAIRVEANADLGAQGRHERTVAVDSLAELTFRISDASDPIEMGAETSYEIRVTNSGSRDDANVRVELELPAGLELISSDADAEQDDQGRVYFEPRGRLDAGGELTYRVKVRGVAPGRHITKATVVSDQSGVAVTKEESTMVYSDR